MTKRIITRALLLVLCLLLTLSVALAETRESVIVLEGEEETIEETLLRSSYGFSLWYAEDCLEAYEGEERNMEGVIVAGLDPDNNMMISVITEEDAEEYVEDLDMDIVAQSAGSRVQVDIYRELSDARIYFLTVIAEKGQYLSVVGEYSQEAAEGISKYFDKVLGSITFTSGSDSPGPAEGGDQTADGPIRAQWGKQSDDGSGRAQVKLTALEPVTDVKLLKLDWDGAAVTWKAYAPLGNLGAQQTVTLTFVFVGDMPDNGIMYTDAAGVAHAYALDISGENGQLILWDLEE